MQNSRFNKSRNTFSPISNGSNGVSKPIGHSISSTPLSSSSAYVQNSIFSPPRLTPLRTPPRYYLSDVSPSKTPRSSNIPSRPVQKVSGPLLASTRFNILGTYTDSKSPGLSSRIVQYNNEAREKHTPTHQAKYGSPGLFPVVHFFKKDIPVISPKLKTVTVKIASPDISLFSNSNYLRNLSNGTFSEMTNGHDSEMQTEKSTRSVLDALKEISRKRLHTSPEFEPIQDISKRQRTNCMSNVYDDNQDTEDSYMRESGTLKRPSEQDADDNGDVDIDAAQWSSSKFLKRQLEKGLITRDDFGELEIKKHKRLKLINAETQTSDEDKTKQQLELTKNSSEDTSRKSEETLKKPSEGTLDQFSDESMPLTKLPHTESQKPVEESKTKEPSSVKQMNIFSEKRLEISRKNKLATLLAAFSGKTPNLIPYDTPVTDDDENKQASDILVSIISPQNKPKHAKHVSFDLPPEKNFVDTNVTMSSDSLPHSIVVASSENNPVGHPAISTPSKDTSKSEPSLINIETPKTVLPVSAATKLNFGLNKEVSELATTIPSISSAVSSTSSSSLLPFSNTIVTNTLPGTAISSPSVGGLSFKSQDKIDVATPVQSSNFGSTSSASGQGFSFGNKQTNFNSEFTSPPTSGGFMFNLNKSGPPAVPQTNKSDSGPSSVTTPGFSFAPNTNPVSVGISQAVSPSLNRQSDNDTAASTANFNFGSNNTSDKPSVFGTPGSFAGTPSAFGTGTPSAVPASNFGTRTSSGAASKTSSLNTVNSANMFNTTSPASLLNPPSSVPSLPFGSANNLSFGVQNSTSLTKPLSTLAANLAPTFSPSGTPFTNASALGANTAGLASTGNFAANNTTASTFISNIFGITTTSTSATPTSAFSVPSSTFGAPVTSAPAFGAPATTAPIFGASAPSVPVFGASATSAPAFGVPVAPAFGAPASSAPTFGAPASSAPTFGAPASSAPTFGAPATSAPTFGASATSAPAFGVPTTSAPAFGVPATSAPVFGGPATSATPSFIAPASTTSVFGMPVTTASAFSAPITSSATPFGANTTPNFNAASSSIFAVNSKGGSSFGSNAAVATMAFGGNTTNSGPFGSSSSKTPASGTPGFGTGVSNTPAFGSNTANTPAPVFGANPAQKTFNFVSNSGAGGPAFGGGGATAPFNFPTTTSAPAFNANKTTPSFGSTFGSSSNQVVPFGSAQQQSAAPVTSANAFGSASTFGSSTSAFGARTESAFGAQAAPFGSNNVATFGSNSNNTFNPPNANTFGNTAGNNQTFGPGFASGDNSAFAKSQTVSNAFGNPASSDPNFQFGNNAGGTVHSNQPAFGSSAASSTGTAAQSGVFAFGSNNPSTSNQPTNVFSFGSSEAPKSVFNFSGGASQPPAFGPSSSGFGSAPPNSGFNANVAQFGTPAPGMFNIGSGSATTNKSRMQLKAKRRN